MRVKCTKCGVESEPTPRKPHVELHMIPDLLCARAAVQAFACRECGHGVRWNTQWVTGDYAGPPEGLQPRPHGQPEPTFIVASDGQTTSMLSYTAVSASTGNTKLLFPVHEGRMFADRSIDPFGNPDLMSRFAAEYLRLYRDSVPSGRLPSTVAELAPSVHVLLVAAELALKADVLRSTFRTERTHKLRELFRALEDKHQEAVERRFAATAPNECIRLLGAKTRTVEDVLGVYDRGTGAAIESTRYLAEPTDGANELKGLQYPIFLPAIVQAVLDVYAHFDGAKRLRRWREGVVVSEGVPAGECQHGDYGLTPWSLRLVAIRVAPQVAKVDGNESAELRSFKDAHPPGYESSWKYAGQSLLFYAADGDCPTDGKAFIDGLECEVWSTRPLGMHTCDLYQLANKLEGGFFPVL